MQEEEFESTRRRMRRLIDDVAALESGESDRALSINAERAAVDPRLVEILGLKRDIEFRLHKAEEERDREKERAQSLFFELEELRREIKSKDDRDSQEEQNARTALANERERREYLEKRLLTVERDHQGALHLFESESETLRDANERLEAETQGLRLSRREEHEQLQGQIRELEGRYWKAQAQWEGERARLETLLEQNEEKNRRLEDAVKTLSAFETRCRELEEGLRGAHAAPPVSGAELPESDALLPAVDPVLDPAWIRVARYLEKSMAAAYANLKRFAGARLGDGHRALLKMTAGEIVRAQDALKAIRHLLESDAETVELGRPEKVIDPVLAAWEPSLRRRGIIILRRMEPTSTPVRFAPEGLRTVVYHLLQNAYEAMPRGGNLTVASEKNTKTGEIIFRISDSGPGFTPERLADPFTPFRGTRPDRLGIGLAIAGAALRSWGGDAEISNGRQGGAVAALRFAGENPQAEDYPTLTGENPVSGV